MSQDERLTKEERKITARENIRKIRETEQKRKKRKSLLIKLGIVFGVVAVLAVVVLIVINMNKSNDYTTVSQPENMIENAAIVGAGKNLVSEVPDDAARVTIFQDYLCPACKQFEESMGSDIERLISDGVAVIDYRVVTFLDAQSLGTNYSSRAANAAYCVANEYPEQFFTYNKLLYANQPAEGTEGLKNADLIALANSVGAENLDSCVKDGTFRGFAKQANKDSLDSGIQGTPTVHINGEEWDKQGSLYDAAKEAGPADDSAEPAPGEK